MLQLSNTEGLRLFICRHGETVFNRAARLQGDHPHTPLTRAGFVQAERMGAALLERLGASPDLSLWSSDTGRALQTLAIIAEMLGLDWHAARTDPRLREIGMGEWGGRYYAEVTAKAGPIIDPATGLLTPAPDGERYSEVASRVSAWADALPAKGDVLVIMHGISSRVLRGVLTGAPVDPRHGVPIAPQLPQGSLAVITGGREDILLMGAGGLTA